MKNFAYHAKELTMVMQNRIYVKKIETIKQAQITYQQWMVI
jgi:hypothetical protein